ncbi:MAG: site-2 protease family protein [Clostridia bacterium]|nr:site-2 protease family protein [Clostridia bacterium]MBR6504127.1 site-2 protease family protein [Clostridia bacterium]
MLFKIKKVIFEIEELLLIIVITLILSPTIRKFLDGYITCYFFILFHELAHIFVANVLGQKVNCIKFRLCGINAVLGNNNKLNSKWLLIFLAGPISNLILACIFAKVKFVFEINLALAIVNLIPIKPLDGYNILNVILNWYASSRSAEKIEKYIRVIIIICLFLLGGITLFFYKNPSILILTIYAILLK